MDSLNYILEKLFDAMPEYRHVQIPEDRCGKRKLMRSFINVLPPIEMSDEFIKAQNEELAVQLLEKGIVAVDSIVPSGTDIRLRLWKGDITRLKTDAIVNAANRQMLGCFAPLHGCIDNAIHSAAGLQLRNECHKLMVQQGREEATGSAKITSGYNLPADYVIHTVGPIIQNDKVSLEDEKLLASCYQSCLQIADDNNLKSIAFCCISTGEYRFPNQRAAEIAVGTVSSYFENKQKSSLETIVFNVFKDLDHAIYMDLIG